MRVARKFWYAIRKVQFHYTVRRHYLTTNMYDVSRDVARIDARLYLNNPYKYVS